MSSQSYSYPLDLSWTNKEMEQVIAMFRAVEDAYEVGIDRNKVLDCYKAFKQVVPSKAEEKQLGREFEKSSGYVLYRVVKAAQESTDKKIKMVGKNND
ncbi:UPF0223 family protein [Limosilactobacillus sp. STM2_1]|uniref:UPF0223 protein H5S09_04640 n=1 Tax=Limosilactobacillus rudii TaxID=2759755 RepID=A0A7W3ULT3_9LACO|nr:UPF0223 family protein [Limosilactobacillus rudii]MBB1078580.1 UPF0223 family protein [Limosilactobacillus rudii]MBB1097220.1 UPF0223 family protein [Limosilactobacillus rudii]MCD7133864.1 UPF0223 family protein [Limosilactobacillus rudii]